MGSGHDVLDFTLESATSYKEAKELYNKLLGIKLTRGECSNPTQTSAYNNNVQSKKSENTVQEKLLNEGQSVNLSGKLKFRSDWKTESTVPFYLELNSPIGIIGTDELCGTDPTKINKIELFDRREQMYKEYIDKNVVVSGKIDCPRGAFVLRDFSINTQQNSSTNNSNTSDESQTTKNDDLCYRDPNPNHILDDPTYCLAYFEEYGERTGLLKGEAKKGLDNLRPLFPVFSEKCNTKWNLPTDKKVKNGKDTARLNLMMILNHSVPANNFQENIDHCLRTISFYGDLIQKMNKSK